MGNRFVALAMILMGNDSSNYDCGTISLLFASNIICVNLWQKQVPNQTMGLSILYFAISYVKSEVGKFILLTLS